MLAQELVHVRFEFAAAGMQRSPVVPRVGVAPMHEGDGSGSAQALEDAAVTARSLRCGGKGDEHARQAALQRNAFERDNAQCIAGGVGGNPAV